MSAKDIITALNERKYPQARKLLVAQIAEQPRNSAFQSMLCFVEFKEHNRAEALQAARSAIALGPSNLQVLNTFLCPVLSSYGEAALLNQAFEAFTRREPPTAQVAELWSEYGLDMSYTKAALRAQTALNKCEPSAVTTLSCCFFMALEHQRMTSADPEFKLYPMLAAKMLDRARPIKAPQQAYVEALVLQMSSKQKMVDYLLTPAVRAYDSLDLNVLLLDALLDLQQWDVIFTHAQSQLVRLDSFNYWQALVKAAVELDRVSEFETFAANFKGHNVCLARIDLLVKQQKDPLDGVKTFWNQIGTKPSATQFLKPYLSQQVVDYITGVTPRSFTETVNIAKVKFTWTKTADVASLISLYLANLDKLPKEKTDYFIGDDLLMMAALQILGSSETNKYYKAALVLELACENDPSQFYVRLWLLKIYRYLGAFGKASAHFEKLSVRNIQLESLGHLVGTRAGSLCPDRKLLRDLLQNESDNLGAWAMGLLTNKTFTQIPGLLELGLKMRQSLSRALLELEAIKTERVLRGTVSLANALSRPTTYSDNRDFKTSFDPCGNASHLCETGPRQTAEWVDTQIAKERVYLAALRGQNAEPAPNTSLELTVYEKWNIDIVNSLGAGQLQWQTPPRCNEDELTWEFLHAGFTILETCKVVDDVRARTKAVGSPEIKQAKTDAAARVRAMQNAVQQQKNKVDILSWAESVKIPNADKVLGSIVQNQLSSLTRLVNALS